MNINRDYLIINDVKKSNVTLGNGSMFFYITDKNTQNIFVNLVINVSKNDLIQKFANIENAEDYTLTMNIVKPDNTYKVVEGKLHDKQNAIFEFDLKEDCCNEIGTYKCELLTKCNINNHEEITTSNKLTYKVKSSILNDLDDIVEAPEYPLVIQLFDKLSDIDQYEEDRRANELARQLAEEQRQTRFNALDNNMADSIQAMDDKVIEVENRISAKEQAVDKLIVDTKADIDNYKVAKDQEIDNYKTAKDTEINEAIANQNTAINAQNDRIAVVENNVVAQNDKLDTLETKATTHEARITAVEAKDTEQDSRLDVAENRLANIGNDITNTMQPIIDEHTSRLDAIEAIDVSQNARLDAIEAKNQQQDDRLLDIEKVNNKQNIDIKCLYGASQTIDVTEEGNSIYLQNSNNGFAIVDEIKGNTLVNCNKEPDKELILNGNINTQGYSNVTLTEGVDGGLVDVALEGNTLVNLIDRYDNTISPQGSYTATNKGFTLTKNYDGGISYFRYKLKYPLDKSKKYTIIYDIVENTLVNTDADFGIYTDGVYGAMGSTTTTGGSADGKLGKIISVHNVYLDSNNLDHLSLGIHQGDAGGKVVVDNLMLLEGDWTDKEIPQYFEGMKSVGECEDLEVTSSNSDGTLSNTQTLTHEPLKAVGGIKDRYVLIDGEWNIERNCGVKAYQDGDIDNYITDMINTVYPLSTPTYELIDYNPFEVYSNTTHISNNSTIPANMTIKNTGYNCLLKPSTTYTVSSNLGLNVVTTPAILTEDCLRFYDTDTSTVTKMKNVTILEGDYTTGKPLPSHFSGIESAFEQEYDEAVGKYKVKIRVQNEDASKENNITFYINEPLRGIGDVKDKVYVKDDKVIVQRNCGIRAYEDGDLGTYLTDKVNTIYPLAEPTYEEVEYNDTKLFIESFKNSTLFYNSNVPVTSKLYYSYSVPIVDTVQQTANVTDQQDSMIIDLATQCAVMEMMLM